MRDRLWHDTPAAECLLRPLGLDEVNREKDAEVVGVTKEHVHFDWILDQTSFTRV